MNLSEMQTLIGNLANDPTHDRYSLSDINQELDNSQDRWNTEAKILKSTVTITVVDGTRQYALSGLTGTPIAITRATHKGIDLEKRSKSWLDLYSGATDWTQSIGTPNIIVIEVEDPSNQYVTLYPTPSGNDAGANLVVEYVIRHTPMSAASDVPFMVGTTVNNVLRPYDFGLAYDVSARLLTRDPNKDNSARSALYQREANGVLANVIQVFKAFEKEEPMRMRGGRYWR
jgi:hypothetical protein